MFNTNSLIPSLVPLVYSNYIFNWGKWIISKTLDSAGEGGGWVGLDVLCAWVCRDLRPNQVLGPYFALIHTGIGTAVRVQSHSVLSAKNSIIVSLTFKDRCDFIILMI